MSYILDALERSEQERKQSELPSFRQDQSLLFMKKKKTSVWPVLIVLVLVLNLIAMLYMHLNGGQESIIPSQSKALSQEIPEVSANISTERLNTLQQSRISNETSPVINDVSEQKKRVVSSIEIAPRPVIAPEIDDVPNVPLAQSLVAANHQAVEEETPIPASSEQPDLVPSVEQPEIIVPTQGLAAKQSTQISDKVVVSATPIEYNPHSQVVEESDVGDDEQYDGTAFLYELDSKARPQVPKLIFNSHIYSSDPSARRVMINNVYLREGQAFEGMTLIAIGDTFVVFEKRGTQFKLPAMRDWLG